MIGRRGEKGKGRASERGERFWSPIPITGFVPAGRGIPPLHPAYLGRKVGSEGRGAWLDQAIESGAARA